MLKRTLAISCLAVFGLGSAAQAADLTVVEEAVVAAPAFNWTGFYAGVHGGYGWGKFDADVDPAVDLKPNGWLGGGQIGFNYQFDNQLVLGVEADAAFADLQDSTSTRLDIFDDVYLNIEAKAKIEAFGTVRARAGYAADRFLPYVTGGLAWANTKYSVDTTFVDGNTSSPWSSDSSSKTMTGWVLGGGLEYAVTNNVTLKAEYLYADLGSENFGTEVDPIESNLIVQTAKAGVNYKF